MLNYPQVNTNENRFDRQIRLWGEVGQLNLSESLICLIGANAVGTETLKNMILPGIGGFEIVDDKLVSKSDVDANFYLTMDNLCEARSQCTSNYLSQLNPGVNSGYSINSIETLLTEGDGSYFNKFSLIIYTLDSESSLLLLERQVWDANIPIVIIHSKGLVGSIQVSLKQHCLMDTHADTPIPDVRLDAPWPEQIEFFNKFNIMDNQIPKSKLRTIPYLILLYHYAHQYTAVMQKDLRSANDKASFRKYIQEQRQNIESLIETSTDNSVDSEEGDLQQEALSAQMDFPNYQELLAKVYFAWSQSITSDDITLLYTRIGPSDELIAKSAKMPAYKQNNIEFWLIVKAILQFSKSSDTSKRSLLPLHGGLPDMNSDSKSYIDLKKIYSEKANRDVNNVHIIVQELLKKYSIDISIPIDRVALGCKHARTLWAQNGSGYKDRQGRFKAIAENDNETKALMLWYICFTSYMSYTDLIASSTLTLQDNYATFLEHVLSRYKYPDHGINFNTPETDKIILEFYAMRSIEFHSHCSVIGGMASQECIKLVTKQFIPLHNTFIFNGITGSSYSFFL